MTEPLLEVRDLDVRYGASQALFGVSVDVAPGTVLAVLGRQRRRQEHAGPGRVRPGAAGAPAASASTGRTSPGCRPTASAGWA